MTLCMAAISWDGGKDEHQIIAGADRRAETAWAGGNVAFKFSWMQHPQWMSLIAGETSKAEDVLATGRAYFASDTEQLTESNVLDKFNNVSNAHKEKLSRRLVRQRLGLDFDRFLTHGETELPSDVRARVFHELTQLEFGCEILTFGFIDAEPYIVEIDRYGEVVLHRNFAAIGTGSVIANSVLYLREQWAYSDLGQTLYHLYEAAKLAHAAAPGVGKIGEFIVHERPKTGERLMQVKSTTSKCMVALEKTFQAVGPKPLTKASKLGSGCFSPLGPQPESEEEKGKDK